MGTIFLVRSDYAEWTGHVIVCGLPGVGLHVVEELTLSGVPAVVVDDDPAPPLARQIAAWGVPLITGSTRAAETLAAAGIDGAIAVICAQHDDLHAMETSLLARRLRPGVRVITQLANPAVGRALQQAGVAVLDVAGLSAPSVTEACLRLDAQEITLSGERFLAARTTAPRAGALRALYGALAPAAVVPADGGDVIICPGRDTPVAAGDEVTLIGTPAELRTAKITDYPERIIPSRKRRPPAPLPAVRHARALALSMWHADRRLALALGVLLAVMAAAVTVLRLAYHSGVEHISVLDALYLTAETVTTVGFGDFTFRSQSPWLMGFAVTLMLTGAMFVAVFFALLTNMIVSRQIRESLGRQQITGLSGHVLVIGLGTVGLRVVRQLRTAGRDVVVVEKNEHNRHLEQVRALGVRVVIADATLPEVLASARLATASAVAVLTSDDLANLETGLAVRDQLGTRWKVTPVVLRIFDPELARSVRETFGFHNVRSTAALAAPWFTGAALGLDVLSTFYAGDEPLLLARLTVTPGGGLDGLAMLGLAARTRVLAIRRAGDPSVLEHPPRRSARFGPDDKAYLIGPYDELLTVLRRDRPSPGPEEAESPRTPQEGPGQREQVPPPRREAAPEGGRRPGDGGRLD